jgi:hypothetical protein
MMLGHRGRVTRPILPPVSRNAERLVSLLAPTAVNGPLGGIANGKA